MLDTIRAVTKGCWTLRTEEVCFVHLGKFGDIMIMLPAFKAVSDQMGVPPICMVSKDYASLFDGVSYVRPWVLELHWWKGVLKAREIATRAGFDPIVIKWWDMPGVTPPKPIDIQHESMVNLKIHGRPCKIQASEWDSFQNSQWRYAGFTMQQMEEWPLVFDRRSEYREQVLRLKHFHANTRRLLVSLPQKGTSPFPAAQQAMAFCHIPGFQIVNLATIKAERIYDLLGLYDYADGLITSDTATLHLAAASKIPYIAFVNNGGAGSTPKGNCILSIRYGEFKNRLGEYMQAIKRIETKT